MTVLDRLSSGWKAWLILFALTFTAAAPGVMNLPALDRDESRFAQASKQYLETGDYLIIRYQDEYRNKKPAGIHWLQSASTALLGDEDRLEIWTYRVPSWLGAAFSTLAIFWAGLVLVGRRASFVGAALYGVTLLLTSEAHISKTDGVLVFLTAWSIGVLARFYMGKIERPKRMALLFWFLIGCSLLIKGPVTPMVVAYAGLGAWVWARVSDDVREDWWKPLLWWPGPLVAAAMFLPWLVAIQIATSGEFIQGAVGKDLKDKFSGASEGHAGWAFYHLTHIPAWFFPATLLFVPGAVAAWKALKPQSKTGQEQFRLAALIILGLGGLVAIASFIIPGEIGNGTPSAYAGLILVLLWLLAERTSVFSRPSAATVVSDEARALRLLVSWAVLTTLFFELMPTRLSHYILPAYPAFGLLCGWAATKMIEGLKLPVSRWLSLVLYAVGGGALLLLSSPLAVELLQAEAAGDFKSVGSDTVLSQWMAVSPFPIWLWVLGSVVLLLSLAAFALRRLHLALLTGVLTSLVLGWHARIYFLPSQVWVQPTESARLALEQVCGVPSQTCISGAESPSRILAVGYAEPSYVMTFGTQNLHPPETQIGLPADVDAFPVVYLLNLEDAASPPALTQMVGEALRDGRCMTKSEPVYALNYSNGDPVHFVALRFDASGCAVTSPSRQG